MSTVCRRNMRLKRWHAFLPLHNNSCLISIPCFGMVRAASASFHLKGACHSNSNNVVRGKKVAPGLTLSSRETKKIWLVLKIEVCKYVSQFPSCLSLTNDPSSWAGNMGLSQFRRQQIYVISLQWQPWNLCGEITAAAFRRGADWCRSAAVTKHVPPVLWTSIRRSCTNEDPCHTWQPLTAIASPLHLCRMRKYIKLEANFALIFWKKRRSTLQRWFNTKWPLGQESGLCISVLSPCPIDSPPGCPQSVIWHNSCLQDKVKFSWTLQ